MWYSCVGPAADRDGGKWGLTAAFGSVHTSVFMWFVRTNDEGLKVLKVLKELGFAGVIAFGEA